MGILIGIGVILFLIWIFSNNGSSGINSNSSTTSHEVERQARERQRLEQQRRDQEQRRQEEVRRQQETARQQEVQRIQEQARLNARAVHFKTNWTNFQTVLQQNNITRLYHFTDRSNLTSIKNCGGLLSWHYCQENHITILKPGGSQVSWALDKRKGLQNFVRTSFVKDHPMMYVAQNDGRITNPIVLEINPEVIYLINTRYACQNAAKNGVTADGTIEKFNSIKFPVLRQRYFDLSSDDKSYYQAEVLVLEKIPLEYITNLNWF